MRNFFDVYLDVKDGKEVSKEELRVALMMARDLLFFAEEDNKKLINCIESGIEQSFITEFVKTNILNRIDIRKAPMENWWKGKIPGKKYDEKEEEELNYLEQLMDIAPKLPSTVLQDVHARISDWLADGGKLADPYIKQQVDYAKKYLNRKGE